jgi:sulfate adenylyltransferase subunit 1 (EFTu-like GTPase family)
MEDEEVSGALDKKKLPKLQSNRKSAKERAVKAFKRYNENLQAGRKYQTQHHTVDVPARLSELQQIEVERLNNLGTMLHQFQSMMVTLQTEIQVYHPSYASHHLVV